MIPEERDSGYCENMGQARAYVKRDVKERLPRWKVARNSMKARRVAFYC